MMSKRPYALLLLTAAPSLALSATFCATNTTQLQQALDDAETNGQADTIRIATGTYTVPHFGFRHNPGSGGDDLDLTISGGWTLFFGNPCGQQLTSTTVFDTLLDGRNLSRVLELRVRDNTDVDVSMLTFLNGFSVEPGTQRGGGLQISGGSNGVISLERCAFIANKADFGAALEVSGGRFTQIVNNLFFANNSVKGLAVEVNQNNGIGVYFTNNTVVSNTTDNTNPVSTAGAWIGASGTSRVFVVNNIFWDNEFEDLQLPGSGAKTLRNNDIGVWSQSGPAAVELDNLSVEPMFDPGFLNFRPSPVSPLVDAGTHPVGLTFFQLTQYDLTGAQRVQGAKVDIGAYEATPDLLFGDGFE